MPRFFTNEKIENGMIRVKGTDADHLRLSLRIKAGEKITLCDGNGMDYLCETRRIERDFVECEVLESFPSRSETPYSVTLFLALTKGEKFDLALQKAVELGADRIVPVLTERCVSRPDTKDGVKKSTRWQKISEAAAKQCGRGKIPPVSPVMDLKAALDLFGSSQLPLFCYENAEVPLSRVLSGLTSLPQSVSALIGPEGGFSPTEAALIRETGGIAVSLGTRILRAETAPLVLLCAVHYAFEILT